MFKRRHPQSSGGLQPASDSSRPGLQGPGPQQLARNQELWRVACWLPLRGSLPMRSRPRTQLSVLGPMLQTFHTPTSKRQGELIRRADSAPSHALEAHLIGPCFRLFPERSYLLRLGFHRTFRRQSSAGPCRTRTHENHVKAIDYERHPATDPGVLTTRTYIGRTTHRPPPTRIKLARVPATATAVRGQDPSFHAATGPSWANLLRPSCSPGLSSSPYVSPPLSTPQHSSYLSLSLPHSLPLST